MDIFAITKSTLSQQKSRYMQPFVLDAGFVYVISMKSKTEIIQAVEQFVKEIGVPTALIIDPKGTQRAMNVKKKASDIGYPLKFFERKTQWANFAEL